MNQADWIQLSIALLLAMLAGLMAAAEAALSSLTRARAERLVEEGRPGALRVRRIAEEPPRYLNTALFIRMVCEISVIVLVALQGLSHEEAACLSTAWLTAYRMLFVKSGARPGATVLVQGASGGVATALVALGSAAGYRMWVTGRTEAKRQAALALGADAAFESGARLPTRVDAVIRK